MESMKAIALGEANRNKPLMVFDWDKAAYIIKARAAQVAYAGLHDDYEWTGGYILKDGEPYFSDYTYLASTWAVPELVIDNEVYQCFSMEDKVPYWDAHTKWPISALKILREE